MEIEMILILAAGGLSLLFAYVPGFKGKYEKLNSEQKQLVMLFLIFVMVWVPFGVGCLGYGEAYACSVDGGLRAAWTFVLAIAANAGVYKATNHIRA